MANFDLNNVTITGRLTKNPTLREWNGHKVVTLDLATNNKQRNGNIITTYTRSAVWGPMAENCVKYLKKGDEATVVGSLRPVQARIYEGKAYADLNISAQSVLFGAKARSGAAAVAAPAETASAEWNEDDMYDFSDEEDFVEA